MKYSIKLIVKLLTILQKRHPVVSNDLPESPSTVTAPPNLNSAENVDSALPPKPQHEEQPMNEEHQDDESLAQDSSTAPASNNGLILPAELWIIIFTIVTDDAYATDLRNFDRWKSRSNLIGVCRGWYDIIQKTKSFWAFLDSSLSLQANQSLVEKSGSCPLTVSGCQLSEGFIKLLNSQLHRVISITLTPNEIALPYYPSTLKLLQTAPILTEFSIKCIGQRQWCRPNYMLNPIIAPLLKVFKVQGLFVHFEHIPQQKSLTRLSTMMGEAELSAMAYSSYVERLSFLRHLEELELLGWPWPPPGSESELRYSGAMEICLPFLRRLRLCMVEPDICLLLLNVITGTPDDIALELDWHWQPSSHDDYLCPFINNLFAQGTLAHAVWQRVRTLHLSILPDTSPGGLYHVQLRGWHVDTMEPNPHSKANLSLVIASDIMEPMLHNMNLSDIKSLHTLQPYVPPLSSFPSLEHLSVKWWYGCGRFLSQLAPTLPSDSSYQEDKQLLVCPRLRTLRVCGNDPSLHLLLQIITCRQMHQATNKLEGSALAGLERLEIGTNANESDENVVSVVEMLKEQLGVEGVQLSRYSDHVYQL